MTNRILYVKRTNAVQLRQNGWPIISFSICDPYYIKCRKDGVVNWSGSVYKASELIERNNVKIVK